MFGDACNVPFPLGIYLERGRRGNLCRNSMRIMGVSLKTATKTPAFSRAGLEEHKRPFEHSLGIEVGLRRMLFWAWNMFLPSKVYRYSSFFPRFYRVSTDNRRLTLERIDHLGPNPRTGRCRWPQRRTGGSASLGRRERGHPGEHRSAGPP